MKLKSEMGHVQYKFVLEVLCMLKDAKCFRKKIEKQELNSDLLVKVLLKKLHQEGIINNATYLKAKEENNNV